MSECWLRPATCVYMQGQCSVNAVSGRWYTIGVLKLNMSIHDWVCVCVCGTEERVTCDIWDECKGNEKGRGGLANSRLSLSQHHHRERERERSRMCLCVFVESSCEWLRIAQGTVLLDSRWMDKCVCVAAGHEGLNNETDKISHFTVWRSLRCHMSTYWCLSLIISYLSGLTDDHRMWSL